MQIFAQIRRIFTLFIETFLNVIRTAGFSWVHSGLLWVRASSDLVTTRVALLAPGDLPKKKKRADGRTDGHDYRAKCLARQRRDPPVISIHDKYGHIINKQGSLRLEGGRG